MSLCRFLRLYPPSSQAHSLRDTDRDIHLQTGEAGPSGITLFFFAVDLKALIGIQPSPSYGMSYQRPQNVPIYTGEKRTLQRVGLTYLENAPNSKLNIIV